MNKEEIIKWLESLKAEIGKPEHRTLWHYAEAIDMAIEALQEKPTKAVPPSLADVYKWERDIALSQLEEYGIGFGEKKRDDLVEVVRCKDCLRRDNSCGMGEHKWCRLLKQTTSPNDFCSYGERREDVEHDIPEYCSWSQTYSNMIQGIMSGADK